MDFPTAWAISNAVPAHDHHEGCSTREGMLCDCDVLLKHPQYLADYPESAIDAPADAPTAAEPASAECFNALCGYDAAHDHGPQCTTDCPCERGAVTQDGEPVDTGSSFRPGDRVYVTDPGLAELRAIMRQFGHEPAPNHHGTVDYVHGGLVVINFDGGNAAPYPPDEVRHLPEGGEEPSTSP